MNEQLITFVQVNGLRIAEIVIGTGEPLLMLHGWGAHTGLLLPLIQRLVPLGYCVYAPDLPGFGKTDAPPTAWSVSDYANFSLDYMNHHNLDRVHLFGHSFGGRISLMLGAEHPERIHRMALADSAGVRPKPSAQVQIRLKTSQLMQNALRAVGMGIQADTLRKWYSARYGSADYKAAQGVMRETFIKVVNEDLLHYAARIKPSTLLLWGDQDEDTPLWQAQLLEKTIPDAGLVVFKGAGHYSYLDKLAETAHVMDYFFKQEIHE